MYMGKDVRTISEPQEVASFVQSIQRTLNCLSDPDRLTRKRALETLQDRLIRGDNIPASLGILQLAWDAHILPALLKSLRDKAEKCRESVVFLIQGVVRVIHNVDQTLLLLLPVMADRIGRHPVSEDSEEIRLQLLNLLSDSLLLRCSDGVLIASLEPLCEVMVPCLGDSFHSVKKGACQAIVLAFDRAGHRLKGKAEQVLRILMLTINHTHSRVRTTVLHAIDAVVRSGYPAAVPAEDFASSIRALGFDHSHNIRALFFLCVARWLGFEGEDQMHGRACPFSNENTTYFPHFLPLLLLGVTDDSADIARDVLVYVEGVGNVFEKEKDLLAASAMEELKTDGSMMNVAILDEEVDCGGLNPPSVYAYPFPYNARPSRGSRRMVQEFLGVILPTVLEDLRDWTVAIRLGAARLLHTLLILAEGEACEKLDALIPALCVGIGEDDISVVQHVIQAVHVLGYHVSPNFWSNLVLDNMTSMGLSDDQRANALVVLAGLLYTTQKKYVTDDFVLNLCGGLSQPQVCLNEHSAVRHQLLAVLINLVRLGGSLCRISSYEICVLLIRLLSVEGDVWLQEGAQKLLQVVANEVEMCSISKFYEKHLRALVDKAIIHYDEWIVNSSERLFFQALLQNAAPYVGPYIKQLLPVFITCLQADKDPAVRLSFLQLLDELFENLSLRHWWSPLAVEVIEKVLIPSGVWHAGKVGAAIRHRAMVALGTFLRQDLCSQMHLLQLLQSGQLISVAISCLEEDFYIDTRYVTAHVFDNILRVSGEFLNDEQRTLLSSVLQKRLDDGSDLVRLGVLQAIRTFFYTMAEGSEFQQIENFLHHVLVHMDDSNIQIQESVCQAVEVYAYKNPGVVISIVKSVQAQHQTNKFCSYLLNVASAVQSQRLLPPVSSQIY